MTTTDKLIRLITAKRDMREALKEKGVETWGGLNIYPDAVNRIGKFAPGIKLIDGMRLSYSRWESVFVDCSEVTSLQNLFSSCNNLKYFNITDTSHITNFSYMFSNSFAIEYVELDISNATTIYRMFDYTATEGRVHQLSYVKFKGNPSKIYVDDAVMVTPNQYGILNWSGGDVTFYYDSRYDYSKIINNLPPKWTAVPYNFEE